MRKLIAAILFCCGLNSAHAQFSAYWNFADFVQNPYAIRQVNITELWNITASGTNIIAGQRQSKQTDLNGLLVISNMVYGAYKIDFIGPVYTNSFTNVFGTGTTGLTNALFALGVSTNSVIGSGYAYTRDQMDAILANFTPGGGSATNAYRSQVGNKLISITTNSTDFIYTISGVDQTNGYPWGALYDPTGTALAQATAATNNYPWGALYDAVGAAAAATNGLGLGSGLAAFRGTNTFASTNAATASARGLVKVDNSTITVASDGTISATTGGGGSVTSVGLTMPTGFTVSDSPVTGDGTIAVTITGDIDFASHKLTGIDTVEADVFNGNGGNLSNLNGANLQTHSVESNSLSSDFLDYVNSLPNNATVTDIVNAITLPLDPLAFPDEVTIYGILGNSTSPVPIHVQSPLALTSDGDGGYDLSSSGGGGGASALVTTNFFVTDTNAFRFDFSTYRKATLQLETNKNIVLTNQWNLTNYHDGLAFLDTWNDTNGGWTLPTIKVAGGLLRTNGPVWRGTNASQYDSATLSLDGTGTNVLISWQTNFQPVIKYTNTISGGDGGGGGGGGTFTFLRSASANAPGSSTATATLDTTGAAVLVAACSWYNTTETFVSDGSTFVALTPQGSSGGTESNRLYICVSPSSPGSGHTFTLTAQYPVITIVAYSLSSGTPTIGETNGFNRTEGSSITSFQTGSVTPSEDNCLVVSSGTWDTSGTTSGSVTGMTIREQHQQGANTVTGLIADTIQTTATTINPTINLSAGVNACSGSTAVIHP